MASEKKIVDRIRYRAEAFANAGIDTAINFGFHVRFDFPIILVSCMVT